MFTDPIKFYLVREKIGDISKDIEIIISYLGTYGDVGIKRNDKNSLVISYPETLTKSTLTTPLLSNRDAISSQQITLTCERKDNFTVNVLKNITRKLGYRIFNPQNNSYLVEDPALIDLTTCELEEKLDKIFKLYKLTPRFQFQNSLVYFATDKYGKIHFVNRDLLEFLLENKDDLPIQKDFSVIVAPDVGHFIALFDRGIVPVSFYGYLLNPERVLNLSGIDIKKLVADIFVAPVFLQYNPEKQNFTGFKFQKDLLRHDKLNKGQSVMDYVTNLLSKFNIPNEILALKVARSISYVRENKRRITPRLNINVFLDK